MRIVEVPFELDRDEVTGGIGAEFLSPQRRSPGLHLGEILRDLDNKSVNVGKRPSMALRPAKDQADGFRYMEMGFIWEVLVEHVWRERRLLSQKGLIVRQGEVTLDDIICTPDAVIIQDWVLQEYKATWKSARRAEPIEGLFDEFVQWGWQIKGYCKAVDTDKASLMVFFVNGNWAPPVPMTKRYDIWFSKREIDQNWDMVRKHRDRMLKEATCSTSSK